MYSRKRVEPRMDPWTSALTGYSYQDFPSRTTQSCLSLRKDKTWPNIYLTWNSIKLKFVKKTSMPNSIESLGYIKCYSSSSPRPVKSPSNSIRCNCKKISSWSRKPKNIWKLEKRPHFFRWSTILLFTSVFKILLTTEKD